ncbi:MAG: hypothetical protein ACOC32_05095 [Nanoarchaeota archaeon]
MKAIQRTLEKIVASIPFNGTREAQWEEQKKEDIVRLEHAADHVGLIYDRYSQLQEEMDALRSKRFKVGNDIKTYKRTGLEKIGKYHSIKSKLGLAEDEHGFNDEQQIRELSEEAYEKFMLERDKISTSIVQITTKIKYLKERYDGLSPLYENIKQRAFALHDDYEQASNLKEELEEEVNRYSKNIRVGIASHGRIINLEGRLRDLAERSKVTYVTDVEFDRLRNHESRSDAMEIDGKKAQFINDEYIGKCIDFIEQLNEQVEY